MIHLQTPIIKETIRPKKTTNALDRLASEQIVHNITTKIYLNDLMTKQAQDIFVKIISLIEPWVYLHTNLKLIDHGHLPLVDDETINLISQGEYVVDYFFNVENEKYNTNSGYFDGLFDRLFSSNQTNQTSHQGNFFSDYYGYFKLSNIVFDLKIKTSSTNRFEIIEKYAVKSLIVILDIITDKLDAIYNYGNNLDELRPIFQKINNSEIDNIKIDYRPELLTTIKKIMGNPSFNFTSNLMLHPTAQLVKNARKSNYQMIDLLGNNLDSLLNQRNDIMYFPYVYYFITKSGSDFQEKTTKINYQIFDNTIINKINEYFWNLAQLGVYDDSRKINFISDTTNGIRSLNGNPVYLVTDTEFSPAESGEPAFYDRIQFPASLDSSSIEIIPRESVYFYNNGKNIDPPYGEETIKSIAEKKHRIILDQSKARAIRSNTHIVDVDRVKINLGVVCKDTNFNDRSVIYPIDANITEIKINRINSTNYIDDVNESWIIIPPEIKSYDKQTIIHKLMGKIFDGDHYLPWYIFNYDRALVRLLFLVNLDHHEYIDFLKQLLNTRNEKQLVNYSLFYCFNYELYSFYNLIWIDPTIAKKYYEIEYLIKFILISDNISKLDDTTLQKILFDFNTSYGWYDPDLNIDTFRNSYFEFRKFLWNIVNELDTIYHSQSNVY